MAFAFATKATKTMLLTTFGLTSTPMMFITLDGVQPMRGHLFLRSVSVISIVRCGANSFGVSAHLFNYARFDLAELAVV